MTKGGGYHGLAPPQDPNSYMLILINAVYVYLSRADDNAWSGLHYNNSTSKWEFTDGSSFVSFSQGNDDLNGIDGVTPARCATFSRMNNRLNDRGCAAPHGYICTYTGFNFGCWNFFRPQENVFRSICLFTRKGYGRPLLGQTLLRAALSLRADPRVLTSSGGHCSRHYTSYWNAFFSYR